MSKSITPRNNKNIAPFLNSEAHGYWELYHNYGSLCYKAHYVNGLEKGYTECYHYNNEKLSLKQFYLR